jgi:hypothetical protein
MLASSWLCLALAFTGGTQTIHVDPALGVDAPGNGAVTQPVRTITFALTQIQPGNAADLRLLPGTYWESSGEVFPLVLVPDSTLTSTAPLRAVIAKQALALTTVFQVPAGSQRSVFVDVAIDTFDRCIQATVTSEDVLELTIEGCELSASRAIAVNVVDGGASVRVANSQVGAGQNCLTIDASGSAVVDVVVERSVLSSGMRGIELNAGAPGAWINSLARNTAFDRCSAQGIRVGANGGGQVANTVESCVFYRNGLPAQPPKLGAITEALSAGGFAQHTITNSAFLGNGADLPWFNPSHWTVSGCISPSGTVCTLPNNVCADPLFVDAFAGDFHLAPGSPAIDAGMFTTSLPAEDFDGDPRPGHPSLSGVALPDIGIDEAYDRALHVSPNPTTLGGPLTLGLHGPSHALAALLIGTAANGAGFGQGLRVALPLALDPVLVGVVPTGSGGVGVVSVAAVVPAVPALLDVTLFEQAVFANGAVLEFGFDRVKQRFR